MTPVVRLHDRDEIAEALERDALLHIYEIGDLDDLFWPFTTWYARREGAHIEEIALVYKHTDLPVLIALRREPVDGLVSLTRGIARFLPRRIYAHTRPGGTAALEASFAIEPHGAHLRMALQEPARLGEIDPMGAVPLAKEDLPEVEEFYGASYPGNWFDPWMIETGAYFGIRRGGDLVCVAGVHVVSARGDVAALGNIATRPDQRGQGLAAAATAALCRHLTEERGIGRIGLNVKADNAAAIACYAKLGFRTIATYDGSMCEALWAGSLGPTSSPTARISSSALLFSTTPGRSR